MLDDKTEVLSQAEEDRLDKQEETELLRLPAGETEVLGAAKDEQTTLRPLERAYLLGIDGPQAGRKHNVRLDLTKVGRDEARNHIHLTGDRKASRRQATIVARGSYYAIVDKRSGNRTFVNRHRLSREEEFALNFGDEIEMGSSTFRLTISARFPSSPDI